MTDHVLLKDAEKDERKRKSRLSSESVFQIERDDDTAVPEGYTLSSRGLIWSAPSDPDAPPGSLMPFERCSWLTLLWVLTFYAPCPIHYSPDRSERGNFPDRPIFAITSSAVPLI